MCGVITSCRQKGHLYMSATKSIEYMYMRFVIHFGKIFIRLNMYNKRANFEE